MAKKLKILSSVTGMQQEVNRLVSEGHDKTFIANYIEKQEEFLSINHKMQVLADMIENHPNYETIQQLKRCNIIFDRAPKADPNSFYYFDPVHKKRGCHSLSSLNKFINPKIFDITKGAYLAEVKYEPFVNKVLYKESDKTNIYNTYIPPEWMEANFYSNAPIIASDLPTEYKLFFKHLVGGHDQSYEYLLDWMANAIKSRNYCFLVTIGSQGIGKGVLGGIIMSLFGLQNSALTALKRTTGQFNSQIAEKRFIQIDEFSMKTRAEEEAVKGLVNDIVEVEKKGRDASNQTNYANFYFTSNSWDALKLEADDRRFSIIDLTDQRLDTLIKDKFEINRIQKDKSLIAQLGQYLYHRPIDETRMLQVFRSKRFEDIKSISILSWQEWLLNKLSLNHPGQEKPASDIIALIKESLGTRNVVTLASLLEFVKQYPDRLSSHRRVIKGTNARQWTIGFKDIRTESSKTMEN